VVDETGPRVEEVTLSGRSISSEDLRSVPLARLRDISVRLASFRPLAAEGEITGAAWGGRDETITAALRQQRRVIDDTHLHEVAETYVGAESNATSTVAEKFGVPRPTAARWVSLARERSLLPPAKRGRDRDEGIQSVQLPGRERQAVRQAVPGPDDRVRRQADRHDQAAVVPFAGHWWIRYEAPRSADGKRRQPRLAPFETEKEAREALVTTLSAARTYGHVADRRTTVAQHLDRMLSHWQI
jgi:transposase-like protein